MPVGRKGYCRPTARFLMSSYSLFGEIPRATNVGAIDDLMCYGLDREGGRVSQQYPRLGYLIKVKMSRKRTLAGGIKTYDLKGVHIYRQPHGTTMADAEASRNGAESWYYCPTDPQFSREVVITITAGDIGITGLEAWYFEKIVGNSELKISYIFLAMNLNQIARQKSRARILTE